MKFAISFIGQSLYLRRIFNLDFLFPFQSGGGHLLPERELQQLTDRERTQILSVIRRDAILQLQVQLKAR